MAMLNNQRLPLPDFVACGSSICIRNNPFTLKQMVRKPQVCATKRLHQLSIGFARGYRRMATAIDSRFAGKSPIEIDDFPSKLPFIGDFPLPCLMTREGMSKMQITTPHRLTDSPNSSTNRGSRFGQNWNAMTNTLFEYRYRKPCGIAIPWYIMVYPFFEKRKNYFACLVHPCSTFY